ncbi:uncharacterized protein LOC125052911 [Pieris napi]|uniref:uncharacterized protein LOC125052911 n=1 Tax=Pieris napi TaxID=78633 RepID=UPI001FBB4033|nr:uncharacterized protein LOC125052911 [Pieris napi]
MSSQFLFYIFIIATIKSVFSINCYQCSGTDSDNPFECNEYLDSETGLDPTDCSLIHDAQYCIKHIGRFEGKAIECYQCNSTSDMECGDGLMNLDGGILKAISCEQVYNAQYCIKEIGGIGTKRYCSSLDLGNQCKYVQQPGDKLEYRTCIHTCTTDGCNSTVSLKMSAIILSIALVLFKIIS